jgi:hypothetical protein
MGDESRGEARDHRTAFRRSACSRTDGLTRGQARESRRGFPSAHRRPHRSAESRARVTIG